MAGFWYSIMLLFHFFTHRAHYLNNNVGFYLPTEFIHNPNILGGYLLLSYLLTFILWKKNEIVTMLPSLIIFIGIILAQSRSILLVAAASTAIFMMQNRMAIKKYAL
jgi:uncharacterized membrane protein YqgA involved in biofilm formation